MANYIKIPADFFESSLIKELEELPGADNTILLYIELLCRAYKLNRRGVFSIGEITLTDAALSSVFSYDNIGTRLVILEQFGLILRSDKSIKVFKYWDDLHDRNSARYREWRTSVFERDGFKCVKCGTRKDIQAHHINTWKLHKEQRYDIENGVTLCRKCHLDVHGGCWRNGN